MMLLVVGPSLGDDDGAAPGGGDLGEDVLTGVAHDDVGALDLGQDPLRVGLVADRPGPGGRGRSGGGDVVSSDGGPSAAPQHGDATISRWGRDRTRIEAGEPAEVDGLRV